jgi:hypothetical protein
MKKVNYYYVVDGEEEGWRRTTLFRASWKSRSQTVLGKKNVMEFVVKMKDNNSDRKYFYVASCTVWYVGVIYFLTKINKERVERNTYFHVLLLFRFVSFRA